MVRLLLIRHGQAVAQGRGGDLERALTGEGRADAVRLGRFLADEGLRPDRALVSPAARTRQTFEALEKGGGRAIPATYDQDLYSGTSTQLLAALAAAADGSGTMLLVGHNPGVAELALTLAGSGDPREIEAMRARFPPCSLALLALEGWTNARAGCGTLERFVMPDVLRARS